MEYLIGGICGLMVVGMVFIGVGEGIDFTKNQFKACEKHKISINDCIEVIK